MEMDPHSSDFGRHYPNLFYWLSYGGKLAIRPSTETEVEVWLGDAGGYPNDGFRVGPVGEALEAAERFAAEWRDANKRLQERLVEQPPDALECEQYIRVAGWPPVVNPSYDPTAIRSAEFTQS
jgi:hypothetical protein